MGFKVWILKPVKKINWLSKYVSWTMKGWLHSEIFTVCTCFPLEMIYTELCILC